MLFFNLFMNHIKFTKEIAIGYALWMCVHWSCSNIYAHFCTPWSGMGFIKSFFLVQSPHCTAISWLTNVSITNVRNLVSVISGWCVFRILGAEQERRRVEVRSTKES